MVTLHRHSEKKGTNAIVFLLTNAPKQTILRAATPTDMKIQDDRLVKNELFPDPSLS